MKLGSIADTFLLNTIGSHINLCGLGKRISLQLVFKHAVYDGVENILGVLRNAGSTGDEGHPECRCSGWLCVGLTWCQTSHPKLGCLRQGPSLEVARFLPSSSHLLTFPTAVPQAGAGAGSEDSLLEVSPLGALSGMRKAGDWLHRGWMAGGISSGVWWLPLSNGALLVFPIW